MVRVTGGFGTKQLRPLGGGGIRVTANARHFGSAEAQADAFGARLQAEQAKGAAQVSRARADAAFKVAGVLGDIFLQERSKQDELDYREWESGLTEYDTSHYMLGGSMHSEGSAARGIVKAAQDGFEGFRVSAGVLNPRIRQRAMDRLDKTMRSTLINLSNRESAEMKKLAAKRRAAAREAALNRASMTPLDVLLREDGFSDFDSDMLDSSLGDVEASLPEMGAEDLVAVSEAGESAKKGVPSAPKSFASESDAREYYARMARLYNDGEYAQVIRNMDRIRDIVPYALHDDFTKIEAGAKSRIIADAVVGMRLALREGGMEGLEAYLREESDGLPPEVRLMLEDAVPQVKAAREQVIRMKTDDLIADGDVEGARILVDAMAANGTLSGVALQDAQGILGLAEHDVFLRSMADRISETHAGRIAIENAVNALAENGQISESDAPAVLELAASSDRERFDGFEKSKDDMISGVVSEFGSPGFGLDADSIAVLDADAPAAQQAGRRSPESFPSVSDGPTAAHLDEMSAADLADLGTKGLDARAHLLSHSDYQKYYGKVLRVNASRRANDMVLYPEKYNDSPAVKANLGPGHNDWLVRKNAPTQEDIDMNYLERLTEAKNAWIERDGWETAPDKEYIDFFKRYGIKSEDIEKGLEDREKLAEKRRNAESGGFAKSLTDAEMQRNAREFVDILHPGFIGKKIGDLNAEDRYALDSALLDMQERMEDYARSYGNGEWTQDVRKGFHANLLTDAVELNDERVLLDDVPFNELKDVDLGRKPDPSEEDDVRDWIERGGRPDKRLSDKEIRNLVPFMNSLYEAAVDSTEQALNNQAFYFVVAGMQGMDDKMANLLLESRLPAFGMSVSALYSDYDFPAGLVAAVENSGILPASGFEYADGLLTHLVDLYAPYVGPQREYFRAQESERRRSQEGKIVNVPAHSVPDPVPDEMRVSP